MATTEPEMNIRQQNIIDSYFEEHHYESAVDALNQFRCISFAPSAAHIRQVLYMALHPSIESRSSAARRANITFPQSPSKFSPSKAARQMRNHSEISVQAVIAARRLLVSFAETNSPAALVRALPSYTKTPEFDESGDCLIAKLSNKILRVKCVWELLAESFLHPKSSDLLASPRRKSRKRKESIGPFSSSQRNDEPGAPVARNSWAALEFLVRTFEEDEQDFEVSETDPVQSKLLLEQLPPSRDNRPARTDFNEILEVIMYCWKQDSARYRTLGTKLLVMLIHLSQTPHVDPPMLISITFAHLAPLSSTQISRIFSEMPWDLDVARFQLLLCSRFINSSAAQTAQARPQARSARAVGRTRSQLPAIAPEQTEPQSLVPTKPVLPLSVTEVTKLLEATTPTEASGSEKALFSQMKFELMVAYHRLQTRTPELEGSTEWREYLAKNSWRAAFQASEKHRENGNASHEQILELILH